MTDRHRSVSSVEERGHGSTDNPATADHHCSFTAEITQGFLQEREATGARGKNWLFFGDQHKHCDFLYEDEIGDWLDKGLLDRLDLAFSRDQQDKVYVQNRMIENSKYLYQWLEEGAYFYVCGDAERMAPDVENALLQIISNESGKGLDSANDYLKELKLGKRYLRDVY